MTRLKKISIFGIEVAEIKKQELMVWAVNRARMRQVTTIAYLNAHCANLAVRDDEYKQILKKCDLVYADGFSIVFAGKILQHADLEKITGREWIYDLCGLCQEERVKLFILGGKPGLAEKASEALLRAFPDLSIVGVADGYFNPRHSDVVINIINKSKADILLVGMGTPRQETWVHKYRSQIDVPVVWTVGALFDYVAGEEKPVPVWLDRLHFEWLWRLILDPRGKWKRYIFGNLEFMFRVMKGKITKRRS